MTKQFYKLIESVTIKKATKAMVKDTPEYQAVVNKIKSILAINGLHIDDYEPELKDLVDLMEEYYSTFDFQKDFHSEYFNEINEKHAVIDITKDMKLVSYVKHQLKFLFKLMKAQNELEKCSVEYPTYIYTFVEDLRLEIDNHYLSRFVS